MRFALGAACLLVGALTAVASIATHDRSWPWLVLAVAAPAATLVALPAGLLRAGFGLGFVGVVLIATLGRPEGDYVISANGRGYALLLAALLLLMGSVVTLPRRRGPGKSENATTAA